MSFSHARSEELLERALKSIPLGTQTFSKSPTQYPLGVSPYFIQRGRGSHVWDVDGNEYVDFVNALNAITLGYCDPDVDAAVAAQLAEGTVFSLAHPIEIDVAEAIIEMVPCAEMVRYGKNGSDATSGAIRLARGYTGRDHVATCGYHGWQDWYIGATSRNLGVPAAVSALTHPFRYNDLDSLKEVLDSRPGQFAAVIMEPMNSVYPEDGFLEEVRELTHAAGALLIFDETITGFRFANGGAQELFGVTPDLATFGKGLANGYPLAAVTGRADVMHLMEEVFFSFTFGGETLSLAAAKATLAKLRREPVAEQLATMGERVRSGVTEVLERHGATDLISISGHPSWTFLNFSGRDCYTQWDVKTLFLQEMIDRGILILTTHNMSYSHSDAEVAKVVAAWDEVVPILLDAVDNGRMEQLLRCEPIVPLFKLR